MTLGPGALRMILALLVLASHLSRYEIGRPAVFVFFALSGYWVTKMYAEKYRPLEGGGDDGLFYLSRLMRVWLPWAAVFLLVFAICAALGAPLAKPAGMLWGLPMLGLASSHLDVLGTSWSLDIELQFYLAVPALVLALDRWTPARLVRATAGLTLAGWALLLGAGLWTFLAFLPAFLGGALIWRRGLAPSGALALAGLGLFLVLGAAVWSLPLLRPLLLRDVPSPFPEDIFGLGWTLLLLPLVAWNVHQRSGALDRHLGNLSFTLYIVHWPVIAVLRHWLNPLDTADKALLLTGIALVTLVAYVLIDRPAEALRRAAIRRLATRPAAGAGPAIGPAGPALTIPSETHR